MINLDDKQAVLKTQGGDAVLNSVDNFPKQVARSWEESTKLKIPNDYKKVSSIVVCGMGGSRFPALILKELFKEILPVPFLINDDYNLPGFVNENTLVILSSYSGTTEEVIAVGKKALEKDAKILGISTGGDIKKLLNDNKLPQYVFNPKLNTSGQPRIGVGYAIGGLLGLLYNLGFIKIPKIQIEESINNLGKLLNLFKINVVKTTNPAKKLAHELCEKYPYYVVSEFLTGVGNAIANQTNETAKNISTFRIIPELNHHLMEGLKHPIIFKDIAVFVLFFSHLYSKPIQARYLITKDVIEQNKIKTIWFELKGKTKLEQVLELIGLGGYLTMYLAALYEQNPAVIPYVDYFKNQLKKMK